MVLISNLQYNHLRTKTTAQSDRLSLCQEWIHSHQFPGDLDPLVYNIIFMQYAILFLVKSLVLQAMGPTITLLVKISFFV